MGAVSRRPAGVVTIAAQRCAREFVRAHTEVSRAPLVPEIALHLATESTPLWRATEEWLGERGVAPPYWAFAWAGGQALARTILDAPEIVRGRRVVDFGCGGGLVALAAMRAGAASARAIDRDPVALVALALNAELNDVRVEAERADTLFVGEAEVVLAGDVFYERADAGDIVRALEAARAEGCEVFAGCPGRLFSPEGVAVYRYVDVPGALELEGREVAVTKVLRF